MTKSVKDHGTISQEGPAQEPVAGGIVDKSERRGPSGYRSGSAKRWRKLAREAPDLHARATAGEFGVIEGLRLLKQRRGAAENRQTIAAAAAQGSPLEAAMASASALDPDDLRKLRAFVVAAIAASAE